MEHVLDNPAWNALISGNSKLSNGNHQVKYFAKEVSPFAGLQVNSSENLNLLHQLLPHTSPVMLIASQEMAIPITWEVLQVIPGLQMVYEQPLIPQKFAAEIVPLNNQHVPQMLALTKLTNPGPFAARTIDFGHYYGIFDGGELVAVAGQRMHVFEFAEISAVCTHPNYRGHGYASELLKYHIQRIKAASNIPFLHVRHDNERAIKVYESLGFSTRKDILFYVL